MGIWIENAFKHERGFFSAKGKYEIFQAEISDGRGEANIIFILPIERTRLFILYRRKRSDLESGDYLRVKEGVFWRLWEPV